MIRFGYLLALLLVTTCAALAQTAGEGRSFVLTLPAGAVANTYAIPHARLLITGAVGANVQIQYGVGGRIDAVSIPPGGFDEEIIDSADVMLPDAEGIFPATLLVTSDSPITCAMMLDRPFASETYGAIADTLLGLEYVAVSSEQSEYGSEVAVIGVHDNTSVTITPSATTRGGKPKGIPFVVKLNRGEVYQMLTDQFTDVDFTGTSIVSDRPCGVLSGSICADLNVGFEHRCNPLLEQLPPVESWGKDFVVGPLERAILTPFRVISRCGGTSVRIKDIERDVIGRGEHYDVLLDTAYRLIASEPVLVAGMVASTSVGLQDRSEAYGDPSMMILAPREQWARLFRFVTPSLATRQDAGGPVGWRHFIQIAMDAASLGGVRVDGAVPIWGRMGSDGARFIGNVEIGPGPHTVTSSDPVGVVTYGYSVSDAYGYNPASIEHLYHLAARDIVTVLCGSSLDTVIDVKNVTSIPITVESASFTGNLTGTIVSPAVPFTIAAGATEQVRIHFTHLGGARGGTLLLQNGACPVRLLSMRIDIAGSLLALAPAAGGTIAFGALPPTIPFADKTVRLTNNGTDPLTIESPTIVPSTDFSVISPSFPLTIPPGASVDLAIRFTPTLDASALARLSLHTAGCPDTNIFTLTGEGRNGSYIAISRGAEPSHLCDVKRADSIRFAIANRGDQTLTIGNAVMAGTPGEFTLLTPLNGAAIAPGDTLVGWVLYTPGAIGLRAATLTLTTNALNGSDAAIAFEAKNDTALLGASPGAVDFGSSYTCDSARVVSITITNAGTVPLSLLVAGFARSGGAINVGTVPGTLAVGDSAVVVVRLKPTFVGALDDSLIFAALPCMRIALPIRGARARVSLDVPDSLDFGIISRCDTSRVLAIALRNDGSSEDTIHSVTLPRSPFFLDTISIPRTIASGDSLQLRVRYHPQGGIFSDSIVVTWGPCRERRVIALRGRVDALIPTLSVSNIDFGATPNGGLARRTLWVANRTTFAYTLTDVSLRGALLRGVRVATGLPVTIPPNDSVLITLEYLPTTAGDTLAGEALLALVSGCGDTLRLTIAGSSIDETTRLALRWESDSASVGSVHPLRLAATQLGEGITGDTLLLRTRLRLNGSVLVPLAARPIAPGMTASIVENLIAGHDRLLTLELRGALPLDGILAEVDARVALGDADSTLLAFDAAVLTRAATGAAVPIGDTVAGLFRVLGICRVGGPRLIGMAGFLKLDAPRPNPVSDRAAIDFECIEDGPVRLVVSDAQGRVVSTLLDADLTAGAYHIDLDARALAGGVYWITLKTASDLLWRGMVVER